MEHPQSDARKPGAEPAADSGDGPREVNQVPSRARTVHQRLDGSARHSEQPRQASQVIDVRMSANNGARV